MRQDATRELLFRDYLIEHPAEAARYEALKRELADQFPTNREAYTNGKNAFIDEIVEKARLLSNT
ncbi:MAG: hypothetical protein BRC40_15410 [Cyanobacteria bacterium QH_8_48_120]|nr:MAG: hypothetical protein BRC34_17120 [Cyanobacteria bacterium QH_1_48_107]PSO56036.1 MAG: hypothetical protein BRC35_10330 [Cyanobacteria bacterium QH_10_48_56]PSO62596.1 MAG: hypothetical protein BRC39_05935 [Cyanobacteria bacterium QH_7_48_89]PSO66415.1 MAG: hypothetical protein BRC38_05835 [Cyanobacteria bacterium QH_6_48_35]PSO69336.1 MAG: hypothetical protein BRC40_15410 [Cyanobacteria bacterium QH_8_48_120]PSO71523.1 MAG: hypothetical protein BRC42_07750 [Cyanobacteria bacterium QS_1